MRRIGYFVAAFLLAWMGPAKAQLGGVQLDASFDGTVKRLARSSSDTFEVEQNGFAACRGFVLSDRRMSVCGAQTGSDDESLQVSWIRVRADRQEYSLDTVGGLIKSHESLFSAYYGRPVTENQNSSRPGPRTWRWEGARINARMAVDTEGGAPARVEIILERT